MLKLSLKNYCAPLVAVAFSFAMIGSPSETQAQWHSNDTTDKGTISTGTLILVGVATVAAIVLISQLSKDGKKDAEKEGENKENPEEQKQEGQAAILDNVQSALAAASNSGQAVLVPLEQETPPTRSRDLETQQHDNMVRQSNVVRLQHGVECLQFAIATE